MQQNATRQSEKTQLFRLLYMLLFAVVLYLVINVLAVLVIVQFIFALFSGAANGSLRNFSRDVSHYIYQIALYLTYNDDRLPFPFNPLYDEVVSEPPQADVEVAQYSDLPPNDK